MKSSLRSSNNQMLLVIPAYDYYYMQSDNVKP